MPMLPVRADLPQRSFVRRAAASLSLLLIAGCGDVDVASGTPCETSPGGSLLVLVGEGQGGYSPGVAGECVNQAPAVSASGEAQCALLVAENDGACDCASVEGVVPVAPEHAGILDRFRQTDEGQAAYWNCFCEIPQLSPTTDAGKSCQEVPGATVIDGQGKSVNGWCYVDGTSNPEIGNPALLTTCAEGWKRMFRFLGPAFDPSPSSQKTFIVGCPALSCP